MKFTEAQLESANIEEAQAGSGKVDFAAKMVISHEQIRRLHR